MFKIFFKIGHFIGRKLIEMQSLGFNLDKFELVGHSLGAQLVGQIGRTTKNKKYLIKKITGLDAAAPLFIPLNPFTPSLNAGDAEYVDVIHTDSTNLGADVSLGHADFWPNAGKEQPGCPIIHAKNFTDYTAASKWWKIYDGIFQTFIFLSRYLQSHPSLAVLCRICCEKRNSQ